VSQEHALTYLDVTDLVEFLQRKESVSGVQRVVVETTPRILETHDKSQAVILDRARGLFIQLTKSECHSLIFDGVRTNSDRDSLAHSANACIDRARSAAPIAINSRVILVFLGALWIADSLMLAARDAHANGAKLVTLLYDLTPVMETGHTAAVNRLFDRYLNLIATTASRVPAISASSRRDFETYCDAHDLTTPQGAVTGLPNGLTPKQMQLDQETRRDEKPWPRDYALFVGTVESRKNHLLALNAWEKLIAKHGKDNVPDLVCVGRLGWNSNEFIDKYIATSGLEGKVSVLSTSVSDDDLTDFYQHCEFTVYPSNYEGWGLPVSESIAFGKVPVAANNSSIPEAGRELAVYFETGNLDDFVRVLEENVLDTDTRSLLEARIQNSAVSPITWDHVAEVLIQEILIAQTTPVREAMYPEITLGKEYVLATASAAPDSGYADQYYAHQVDNAITPLLAQPRDPHDYETVDAALRGNFGSPQTWGYEVRPGNRIDVRITRPTGGALKVLFATRSMPGVVTVEASGPGGPKREELYLGSVLELNFGDGTVGEPAQVSFSVTDATDSVEGFLGIRSFVVLAAGDKDTEVLAHKSAAQALRQELDFLTNTRSWKVTAPLRKLKGRGSA